MEKNKTYKIKDTEFFNSKYGKNLHINIEDRAEVIFGAKFYNKIHIPAVSVFVTRVLKSTNLDLLSKIGESCSYGLLEQIDWSECYYGKINGIGEIVNKDDLFSDDEL